MSTSIITYRLVWTLIMEKKLAKSQMTRENCDHIMKFHDMNKAICVMDENAIEYHLAGQ